VLNSQETGFNRSIEKNNDSVLDPQETGFNRLTEENELLGS